MYVRPTVYFQSLRGKVSKQLLAGLVVLTVALSLCSAKSFAIQSVGNAYVSASVEDGSGLVSIYYAPTHTNLSYFDNSFLTVSINGKYYTNNPFSIPPPAYTRLLNDGIVTKN